MLVIPIKRVERLLLIEARIDTLMGNFVIDTGAPGLILNHTYFRNYWVSSDVIASNAGGLPVGPVKNTWIDELELKELRFEKIKASLTELGHIENRNNIRILGLLGVEIFREFIVTIDLHQNVLILQKVDKRGQAIKPIEFLQEAQAMMSTPIKLIDNTIVVPGSIAGKKMSFCLDTGAETNVLNSNLPQKVLSTFTLHKQSVLLGTGGARVEVLAGKLQEITIGTMTFKNMSAVISNLESLGEAYGVPIEGMIGYDFLIKGIISINFVSKQLSVYPFLDTQK